MISTVKKLVFLLFRYLVGALFIFSGAVKAIDPLGTVYKIQDYLVAMHLEVFNDLALVASFALFIAEFLAGALLFSNIRFKFGLWLTTLFMVSMTPLTLWIALANPVPDCGCFGDAVVISNWATFWKNIVLSAMIAYLWWQKKCNKEWLSSFPAWTTAITISVVVFGFGLHAVNDLPLIDFRPYKIGANIYESMQLPEDAVMDSTVTTYIYAKNGEQKEFSLADAPYSDSTWVFVDQKTLLIRKGDEPAIHDFSIVTPMGDDITEEVLFDEGCTYFVVMYDLEKTNLAVLEKVDEVYEIAKKDGARFIVLTTSSHLAEQFNIDNKREYPFGFTDPIQLKTMVRSNPGVVVMRNGVVVDKYNPNWHSRTCK